MLVMARLPVELVQSTSLPVKVSVKPPKKSSVPKKCSLDKRT